MNRWARVIIFIVYLIFHTSSDPVAVLARLAVDREWQSQGIGRGLFRNATNCMAQAADVIVIRGIVVHAFSEDVKKCYLSIDTEDCSIALANVRHLSDTPLSEKRKMV